MVFLGCPMAVVGWPCITKIYTDTLSWFDLNVKFESHIESKFTLGKICNEDLVWSYQILHYFFCFNTIFLSSHMYPENPERTQVIVGSMNMGYISNTARNQTYNLFRPKREPIPLCHTDRLSGILPCPNSTMLPWDPDMLLWDSTMLPWDSTRIPWDTDMLPWDCIPCSRETLPCSHGTLQCSHGIVLCSHGTLPCSNGTLTCSHGTLPCSRGTLPGSHETLQCSMGSYHAPMGLYHIPMGPNILPWDPTMLPWDLAMLPWNPTMLPWDSTMLPSDFISKSSWCLPFKWTPIISVFYRLRLTLYSVGIVALRCLHSVHRSSKTRTKKRRKARTSKRRMLTSWNATSSWFVISFDLNLTVFRYSVLCTMFWAWKNVFSLNIVNNFSDVCFASDDSMNDSNYFSSSDIYFIT